MKKHEASKTSIGETIKTISVTVTLILTIGSVVASGFNLVTVYKLQPLASHIDEVEKEVKANKEQQVKDIEKLATKEQVDTLITDMGIIKENLIKKGLQ